MVKIKKNIKLYYHLKKSFIFFKNLYDFYVLILIIHYKI